MKGIELGGRYLIESEIARGGMATVWLATDKVLERKVAAKVLHEHLAQDDSFRERFRVEALAAAQLVHANVVSIYDTGDHDGVPFIVMEHLAGGTLAQMLGEKGSIDPSLAATIGVEVCHALDHAHTSAIIHRDIKPGNILFTESGHPKVTDFGIAKAAFADTDLTSSGALLGTVRYLSPEQVRGEVPDGRADIYALGVVLYECVTGRPAFSGESDLATATSRLTELPPRPRDLKPGLSRELDSAIMRALAIDRDERFAHAGELAAALERHVDDDAPTISRALPAVPESFVKSETRWLLPAVVVIVLAAAVVALAALPGPRDALRRLIPQMDQGGSDGQELDIVGARTYDPGGDGVENEEDAAKAIDGEPETFWRTDYYSRAQLGGLKDGVGLFVDLQQARSVSTVRVLSTAGGWRGSIRYSDDGRDWSSPGTEVAAGAEQVFEVDGEHRYWMVWITSLTDQNPSGSGRWWVGIREVELAG